MEMGQLWKVVAFTITSRVWGGVAVLGGFSAQKCWPTPSIHAVEKTKGKASVVAWVMIPTPIIIMAAGFRK